MRAEAAEREAAEARAALELVERQRKALQDVMAGERKAHAAALGDQVYVSAGKGVLLPLYVRLSSRWRGKKSSTGNSNNNVCAIVLRCHLPYSPTRPML